MLRFASTWTRSGCCGCLYLEFRVSESSQSHLRRKHVYAPQFGNCVVDDDHERWLLGFVGGYLQGCEELPLRTFLLGLCDWDFSDFADSGADDGEHGD